MCIRGRQPIQTSAHELILGFILLHVVCCIFSFNPNCVLDEWVSVTQVAWTTGVRLLEDTTTGRSPGGSNTSESQQLGFNA